MSSDRPKRPHGTFTPASTISRVLGAAGYKAFAARKDTAFGGHRCSWDQTQGEVRVGYWCGDDTPDADRASERAEMLAVYLGILTAAGYPAEYDSTGYALHISMQQKEN